MLRIYFSIRMDAVAIIKCAIIVDASKFAQFCRKKEEGGSIKTILLRSERRRRLRGAKNERQNFLIGRP